MFRSILLFYLVIFISFQVLQATTTTEEEEDNQNQVSIAYFIQISDSTLTLLPRLLSSVWHSKNVYVIHFDKKIPQWQRDHAQTSLFHQHDKYISNVKIMPSEVVTYRGISMVLNILNAMQFALNIPIEWDYWINISGSDYPLVSPINQRKLLATHDFVKNKRNFFSISDKQWWKESEEFRFTRLFIDTSISFNESKPRIIDSYTDQPISKFHNFTWVAAETWMILHRSYINYLLKSSFARRMLIAFSYAIEPEEHYFATIAYNTPNINATVVPHALRLVVWKYKGKQSGQHPYYIDEKHKDGKSWIFRKKVENSGCFFARKVRNPNSSFLKFIDTYISGVDPNADQKSVKAFLDITSRNIQCVSHLKSGDITDHCSAIDEDEEEEEE